MLARSGWRYWRATRCTSSGVTAATFCVYCCRLSTGSPSRRTMAICDAVAAAVSKRSGNEPTRKLLAASSSCCDTGSSRMRRSWPSISTRALSVTGLRTSVLPTKVPVPLDRLNDDRAEYVQARSPRMIRSSREVDTPPRMVFSTWRE
jgi:hypothetical protein